MQFLYIIFLFISYIHTETTNKKYITSLYPFNQFQGYSTYSRSFAPSSCYKATKKLSDSIYIHPMDSKYQMVHTIADDFGIEDMFENVNFLLQRSQLMEYFNIVKDNFISLGFNYYSLLKREFNVSYNYDDILTEEGKRIIKEDKENFIYQCGDYFIKNYDYGMGLIYSIILNFDFLDDKREFILYYNGHRSLFTEANYKTILFQIMNLIREKRIVSGNIELYAIQIGGNTENKYIYDAMKDNQYKIKRCNFTDVKECFDIIDELYSYSINTFERHHKETAFMIPLENFNLFESIFNAPLISSSIKNIEYSQRIDNTPDLNEKRAWLYHQMENLQHCLLRFEYIKMFFPLHIREFEHYYIEIHDYYSWLIKDNRIFNCYQQFKDISPCYNEIVSRTNEAKTILDQYNIFIEEFAKIPQYVIHFSPGYCLPEPFQWYNEGSIYIKYFRDEAYVENDLGLECEIKHEEMIRCTDGIFRIELGLEKIVNDEDGEYYFKIECQEKSIWYTEHYVKFALKEYDETNRFHLSLL